MFGQFQDHKIRKSAAIILVAGIGIDLSLLAKRGANLPSSDVPGPTNRDGKSEQGDKNNRELLMIMN